jgi:hypothetical protein
LSASFIVEFSDEGSVSKHVTSSLERNATVVVGIFAQAHTAGMSIIDITKHSLTSEFRARAVSKDSFGFERRARFH